MPNTEPNPAAGSAATPPKRVHVAVGVISDGKKILVARRPEHVHQGGLWEFPGGKVEAGETVQQALYRELLEELAIEVQQCEPLLTVVHDYVDKSVLLDVWWISDFSGEPHGREGQPLRWVSGAELCGLEFPQANRAIVIAVEEKLAVNSD
jgi:8-oxo-dGTP diphosphatase